MDAEVQKEEVEEDMMEVGSGDEPSSEGSDIENELDDELEDDEEDEEDIDELQDLLEEEEIHGLTHRRSIDGPQKGLANPQTSASSGKN